MVVINLGCLLNFIEKVVIFVHSRSQMLLSLRLARYSRVLELCAVILSLEIDYITMQGGRHVFIH
jgi:hypothetical protein